MANATWNEVQILQIFLKIAMGYLDLKYLPAPYL